MGHYASEMMEDWPADKWNYRRVNELGFKSISQGDLKVCPVCKGLVRGQEAEEHYAWHESTGGFPIP